MEEERGSIGQSLRRRREEQGLSVEEASGRSRVPLRLLQALESDDYRLLPDPLYLIRFLHDYARLLGLDPAAMEAEFQGAVRHPTRVPVTPASTAPAAPGLPWKQVAWAAGALLVVTPLVFIALSLASKRASERASAPASAPVAAQAPAAGSATGGGPAASGPVAPRFDLPAGAGPSLSAPPIGLPSPGASPGAVPALASAPAAGEAAPPAPPPAGPQVLVARAQEQTWLVVSADGGAPREVLLQAGQSARFTAARSFLLTVGNAGGVSLTVNGVPVAPLGRSGQVVRDLRLPQPGGAGSTAAAPADGTGR